MSQSITDEMKDKFVHDDIGITINLHAEKK